jgi:hypothetical protein
MLVLAMQFSRGVRRDGALAEARDVGALLQSGTEDDGASELGSGGTEPTTVSSCGGHPSSECINWEFSSGWR